MRYRDYMNQFTVTKDAKSALLKKMKARARQQGTQGTEEVKQTYQSVKDESVSQKKNTFRLHPKRWIAIALSAVLVMVTIPTVYYYASFRGKPNHLTEIKLEYMDSLMVETDGVTAYSIRKETAATPKSLHEGKNQSPAISLLNASVVNGSGARLFAEAETTRNYLYSTSESYELGNVEYDETGIQKVTFMKNREVTEDVYDDNGELIDSERKITQEELDAQINKIYTTKEYTYLQFVAPVKESGWYEYKTASGETGKEYVCLRPSGMKYDEQGVAAFDKVDKTLGENAGYYSSALSASFVIDNATGYLYKIENFQIYGFRNGLVMTYRDTENQQGEAYYTIGKDENQNLVFTDVMPNEDITVDNVLLDAYGWTFVLNNRINEINRYRKIIYVAPTDPEEWKDYVFDADRYVYVIGSFEASSKVSSWELWTPEMGATERSDIFHCLEKKIVDGEEVDFEASGTIKDLRLLWNSQFQQAGALCSEYGAYENMIVKRFPHEFSLGVNRRYMAYNRDNVDYGLMVSFLTGTVRWLDHDWDTLILFEDGGLFYAQVNLDECFEKAVKLSKNSFTTLASWSNATLIEAENYYLSVGDDQYKINDVYYILGVNTTKYYHVVKTTTGVELVELTSKSYTDNVFIFQPINK